MLIRWQELGPQSEPSRFEGPSWSQLLSGKVATARELGLLLEQVEPRLQVREADGEWFLLYDEVAARPVAEICAAAVGRCRVGRPALSHESALAVALSETGVDLSTSRVRMGFTRGHLLEIVVSVPLDVEGDEEALQVASEIYLEERLGDLAMDRWVANVSVSRIARSQGLLVVQDITSSSETRPLRETGELKERAETGVFAELPACLLGRVEADVVWTALEIPALPGGLQEDRVYASTSCPEALKAALEGLPFSSERFTRGQEVFCYFSWSASGGAQQRTSLREKIEAKVRALGQELAVAGTGFGLKRDYLDLWALPEASLLRRVANVILSLCGDCELGFYDSKWGEEHVVFERRALERD